MMKSKPLFAKIQNIIFRHVMSIVMFVRQNIDSTKSRMLQHAIPLNWYKFMDDHRECHSVQCINSDSIAMMFDSAWGRAVICISVILVTSWAYNIDFDEFKVVENCVIVFDNIRIKKFNRTAYVLDGGLMLPHDLREEDNIQIELNVYHSRLGNQQFVKSPFKLPKDSLCNYVNVHYRKYLMEPMKDCSNFPHLEPEENGCPLKKVSNLQYLKHFLLNSFRILIAFLSHSSPEKLLHSEFPIRRQG